MLNTTAIGNLGKDAEVKDVKGKKVIEFSIAHSEKWKDASGTPIERTTWVKCSYWAEKTTISQYLKKGTKVWVTGTPSIQAYISNQDHKPAASLNLRVDRIELLDKKPDTPPPANGAPATSQQPAAATGNVEDYLPF